jgi:hypothetical protein
MYRIRHLFPSSLVECTSRAICRLGLLCKYDVRPPHTLLRDILVPDHGMVSQVLIACSPLIPLASFVCFVLDSDDRREQCPSIKIIFLFPLRQNTHFYHNEHFKNYPVWIRCRIPPT